MKKFIAIISIFLVTLFFPFKHAYAYLEDDSSYKIERYDVSYGSMDIHNINVNINGNAQRLCVSDYDCITINYDNPKFSFYEVNSNYSWSDFYHVYSLDINSQVDRNSDVRLNKNYNYDSNKMNLLSALLVSAPQYNDTFYERVRDARTEEKQNMLVTQILIWEIMNEGRNTFETVNPNLYNGDNSFYKKLIIQNASLKQKYSTIVTNANDFINNTNIPSAISSHNTPATAYNLSYDINSRSYRARTGDVGYYSADIPENDELRNYLNLNFYKNENQINFETNKYFKEPVQVKLAYMVGRSEDEFTNFHIFRSVYNSSSKFVLSTKSEKRREKIYLKCSSGTFQIKNLDKKTQTPIYGAAFQILNSQNIPLNFTRIGNTFTYNAEGTTDRIAASDTNVYEISNLPDGEYSIIQTGSANGYILPPDESDRITKIKISNSKLSVYSKTKNIYIENTESIILINGFTTQVDIVVSGKGGVMLEGVIFNLYSEDKSTPIPLVYDSKTGIYKYSTSGIPNLGLTTNSYGRIIIENLPIGKYALRQVTALEEYEIAQEWYDINVTSSNSINVANQVLITNAQGEFNFYKIDENGKNLTGGIFKIQKYNNETGAYEDASITEVDMNSDNTNVYRIDYTSKVYEFRTKNGVATFQNIDSDSKYKIVELEAPKGYQLYDIESANAVVETNSKGYAKNSATIINKQIIIDTSASSNAELILNIRTGQTVIKYGIVLGAIALIIFILIILRKKLSK